MAERYSKDKYSKILINSLLSHIHSEIYRVKLESIFDVFPSFSPLDCKDGTEGYPKLFRQNLVPRLAIRVKYLPFEDFDLRLGQLGIACYPLGRGVFSPSQFFLVFAKLFVGDPPQVVCPGIGLRPIYMDDFLVALRVFDK